MGIQKLVISNFKSHKHTELLFDRFTCIIGLNGCGKSNILDALCYVLMYSEKYIRTSSLEELMYDKDMKTSVYIILSMSDNTTVRLSRMHSLVAHYPISEYVIDDRYVNEIEYIECISQLNVSKCIILQNNIEKIVCMEPLKLTCLIEELSGSVQFKEIYLKINDELKKCTKECKNIFEKIQLRLQNKRETAMENEKKKFLQNHLDEKAILEKKVCLLSVKEKELNIMKNNKVLADLQDELQRHEDRRNILDKRLDDLRSTIRKSQIQYIDAKNSYKKTMFFDDGDYAKIRAKKMHEKKQVLSKITEVVDRIKNNEDVKLLEKVDILKKTYDRLLHEFNDENRDLVTEIDITKKKMYKIEENEKNIVNTEKKIKHTARLLSNKHLCIDNLKQKICKKPVDELVALKRKEKELNEILGHFLQQKSIIKIEEHKDQVIQTLKALYSGVKGKLKDLVTITQHQYVLPINVLLGKNSQMVVTDTKDTALKCIKYLNEKKLCKLTFFPINNMKKIEKSADTAKGLVRAADCMLYDNSIQPVIDYVFNNCFVMLDENVEKNDNYKYVTLSGTLFHKKVLISGGPISVAVDHNIIKELNEISSKIHAYDHINIVLEKINEIEEETKILNIEQKELERCIQNLSSETDVLKKENPFINAYFMQLCDKMNSKKVRKFQSILDGFASIEELEMLLDCDKIHKKHEEKKNLLNELKKILQELNHEIEEIDLKIDAKKNENNLKTILETTDLELKKARSVFDDVKNQKDECINIINEIAKNITLIKHTIDKVESEKENIIQTAIMEDIISSNDLASTDFLAENIIEIQNRLSFLNEAIDKIYQTCSFSDNGDRGEEDVLKKLQDMYEIKKQKTNRLRTELKDIKKRRLILFTEGYGKISDYLGKIAVFFEQSAQLTHSNNSEPYMGGTNYFVLKNEYKAYNDLSEGEKAIAALCLILAINKYINAPFYFFDEIDSALDKTRITLLSEYLSNREKNDDHDLFKNDQFICISLKKDFFTNADSLIGIYKTDDGSRTLSYRLHD